MIVNYVVTCSGCRIEFEKNSVLRDSEEIQFQLGKANRFLENKWLV